MFVQFVRFATTKHYGKQYKCDMFYLRTSFYISLIFIPCIWFLRINEFSSYRSVPYYEINDMWYSRQHEDYCLRGTILLDFVNSGINGWGIVLCLLFFTYHKKLCKNYPVTWMIYTIRKFVLNCRFEVTVP